MKYLEILKEMDKELFENSVTNIITHTSCENLNKIVDDLNKKVEIIVVNKALKNRLNKFTTGDEEYVCYIEYLLDNNKILKLSKEFIGLIISKVKPLLASDKKEEQVSALRLLSKIEEIPQKKKNLVKTLLEAINDKNFLDEEKKVLEKVKKKVI